MFLPVVADQIAQAVHRLAQPRRPRVEARLGGPPLPAPWAASAGRCGVRYQLLRALRAMDRGQMMLVARRLPALADPFRQSDERQALLRSLRDVSGWRAIADIEPLLVPGTAHPGAVGMLLLRLECCAPSPSPHWIPNLRFFFLTERGHQMAQHAEAWWRGLNTRERLQAMLFE